MKRFNTIFTWSWNNRAAAIDSQMTRDRAARLLRAWRRTSRKPTSMGTYLRTLNRIAPHTYRVEQLGYGESAVMSIINSGED